MGYCFSLLLSLRVKHNSSYMADHLLSVLVWEQILGVLSNLRDSLSSPTTQCCFLQYCFGKYFSLSLFDWVAHWKRLWCWEGLEQEEKGTTEDEMAGWHHWLDGRESEWTPGVCDGQGGLVCCDSWGRKESDTTERLNWTSSLSRHMVFGVKTERVHLV